MLIRIWIVSGILLGLACFAIAQQKPDFSGEWTLNRQASTLSPGAAAVQSGVVRIEHRDPTFRYKASFVTASGPLQYEYELHSDGRDIGATQNGVTTLSNFRWEGEALVARWRSRSTMRWPTATREARLESSHWEFSCLRLRQARMRASSSR